MALYADTSSGTAEQKIHGQIAPYPGEDYPTHEDTDGKGGYMCVANYTERNAIPTSKREIGMVVFVSSVSEEFILDPNLSTWISSPDPVSAIASSLYTYTLWGSDASATETVQYKWHDGRLELIYRMKSIGTTTNSGSGDVDYGAHSAVYWKTTFIENPVVQVSGYDNSNGLNWGAIREVNRSYFRATLLAIGGGTGITTVYANGRWK